MRDPANTTQDEKTFVPTWTVTFDAKREPMFEDERGGGWVPLARHDEVCDELHRRLSTTQQALKGLVCQDRDGPCWCATWIQGGPHQLYCLAARAVLDEQHKEAPSG